MFFAFFVLIINQTTDFVEESQAICKIIGKQTFLIPVFSIKLVKTRFSW